MKKKVIVSATVVLVLSFAGYFMFLRGGANKYDFRFDNVSKGDLTVYVTATGTINAVTSVDVGTQVSGIISKLYADFNSVVKEGQVIAQIDPTFLQQSVKDAEANLERAKAQFADSKRILERTKVLYDKSLESQVNYDAAVTNFESNQAAVKQAEASLDRAKINLAYATIYAPINGVVIDRKVNVGQTVAASFSSPTLYTIANDLRKMQVQTTVDESDIGRVSIGQEATFTVDAYPDEKFSGTVSQIRLAPVSIQNVVNYTVIVDVNNDRLKLMPGMTANVKVLAASSHDVLRVPNMALRFQPPADVIDSTKIKAQREALFASAAMDDDADPSAKIAAAESGARNSEGDARSANQGTEGSRKRFEMVRDSIQAAHGGSLSQEQMKDELAKAFRGRRRGESQPAAEPKLQTVQPPRGTRFGITQSFPEYQKSAYVPLHESGRGRLWILNAQGKLEPVFVRTGVTDGRFTEITSKDLKPGDQVVMGVSSISESEGGQATSPLTGSGGQRMRGMR